MDDSKIMKKENEGTNRVKSLFPLISHNTFSDQLQTPPTQKSEAPLFTIGLGSRYFPSESSKKEPGSASQQDGIIGKQSNMSLNQGLMRSVSSPILNLMKVQSGSLKVETTTNKDIAISKSEGPHDGSAPSPSSETMAKMMEKSKHLPVNETKTEEKTSPSEKNILSIGHHSKSLPCTPSTSPKCHRKELSKAYGNVPINKYGGMFRKESLRPLKESTEDTRKETDLKKSDMSSLSTRLKDWMTKTPVNSQATKDLNVYAPTSF